MTTVVMDSDAVVWTWGLLFKNPLQRHVGLYPVWKEENTLGLCQLCQTTIPLL